MPRCFCAIFPLPRMPCQEITHVKKEGLFHISAGCTPRAKMGTREEMVHSKEKGYSEGLSY